MKTSNKYYFSYSDNNKKIDYLKYGINNEFGYNLFTKEKEEYDEEKITKIK